MIDTIVLRIHNLSKYPEIYEQYYAPANKKNSFTEGMVDKSTGEIFEMDYCPALIYHDSNRILMPRHRSHINIPSSHYHLSYSVDSKKNYLEFNFSIPKYCYSTNVMQFLNEIDSSANATFNKLISFLIKFFAENFIKTPLFEDIEINRIDLCYNQFFVSKEDALAYLDEQKKLLVKYARSSKNNFRSYDTSLMYITRRYSFKIYHKGTEFEKHDAKELAKNGNPKNLPLQYFQEQADTILRYEMTFRTSFLSYLMQHYFFTSEAKSLYPQFGEHTVPKTWQKIIALGYAKVYQNYCRTGKFFTLKSIYDYRVNILHELKDHNSNKHRIARTDYNLYDTVTFDESIFQMLHDTFWAKVQQYQLSQVMDVTQLSKKIDEYKSDVKTRSKLKMSTSKEERTMDKTRMLILGLLVNQNYNIDNLKAFIPLRTFERIKHDLKKLGITSNHTNLSIVLPKLDYLDYRIFFGQFIKY